MRALEIHAVHDLRIITRETPEPGPGEVRVHVEYGGICGSDLAYWRSGVSGTAVMTHPFVLGHEVSGTISALGEGAGAALRIGQAVAVHPASTLGPLPERLRGRDNLHPDLAYLGSAARTPHTDGGFAEEIVVSTAQTVPLPEGLGTRRAVLAEPLGVALHAVHRAGEVRGKHVLVSGCGPVGLLVILAAKEAGASRITAVDPAAAARERALAVGADAALGEHADTGAGTGAGAGVTVAFEASGAPASLTAVLAAVGPASTVVQVGNLPIGPVPVALGPLVSKEIDYRGTYRFVSEIRDAVDLLSRAEAADAVISHVLPLADADSAFATAAEDRSSSKVVLKIG